MDAGLRRGNEYLPLPLVPVLATMQCLQGGVWRCAWSRWRWELGAVDNATHSA